jgi:hypothetical protein
MEGDYQTGKLYSIYTTDIPELPFGSRSYGMWDVAMGSMDWDMVEGYDSHRTAEELDLNGWAETFVPQAMEGIFESDMATRAIQTCGSLGAWGLASMLSSIDFGSGQWPIM